MYPTEVPITNFSEEANLFRNENRCFVDDLFEARDKTLDAMDYVSDVDSFHYNELKARARQQDMKARQIWRDIITKSNAMNQAAVAA